VTSLVASYTGGGVPGATILRGCWRGKNGAVTGNLDGIGNCASAGSVAKASRTGVSDRRETVFDFMNDSLFTLIAIQMQALKISDSVTLVFTTVMDELSRGHIDEDEDAEAAPTDRAYWEKRGSKATVALADQLLAVLKELDPSLELKYNKFYIGLSKDGQPYNFVSFRPKKNQLNFELKLAQSEELDAKIEKAGIETLEYNKRWGLYRLRLTKEDIKSQAAILKELMQTAYERRSSI
jgi:predicted transport protein